MIFVWIVALIAREHLTECLKNAIKPHQVNIGKTKDEMGYLPEEYRERLIGYLRCLRDDMKK